MTKVHLPGLITVSVALFILFLCAQAESHEGPPRYRDASPAYGQNDYRNDFYYQNRIAPPPAGYYYRQRSNNRGCGHCAPRQRYQQSRSHRSHQMPAERFNRPMDNRIPSTGSHTHGNMNPRGNNRQYEEPNRLNYPPPVIKQSNSPHSHQHSTEQGTQQHQHQNQKNLSPPPRELPQMEIPSIEPLTP